MGNYENNKMQELKKSIDSFVLWGRILGLAISSLIIVNLIITINQKNHREIISSNSLMTISDYAELHSLSPFAVRAAIAEQRISPKAIFIGKDRLPRTLEEPNEWWLVKAGSTIKDRIVKINTE